MVMMLIGFSAAFGYTMALMQVPATIDRQGHDGAGLERTLAVLWRDVGAAAAARAPAIWAVSAR
jgi:hypothetical protein